MPQGAVSQGRATDVEGGRATGERGVVPDRMDVRCGQEGTREDPTKANCRVTRTLRSGMWQLLVTPSGGY